MAVANPSDAQIASIAAGLKALLPLADSDYRSALPRKVIQPLYAVIGSKIGRDILAPWVLSPESGLSHNHWIRLTDVLLDLEAGRILPFDQCLHRRNLRDLTRSAAQIDPAWREVLDAFPSEGADEDPNPGKSAYEQLLAFYLAVHPEGDLRNLMVLEAGRLSPKGAESEEATHHG